MKLTRYDEQINQAFDSLVERLSTSEVICDVALNGGEHEKKIEEALHCVLTSQSDEDSVLRQYPAYYNDKRKFHDIVVTHGTKKAIVIEIKSIFTDPGGISSKTGKNKGFEKDFQSLRLALVDGFNTAYELVVLFECFEVSKEGEPTYNPNSEIKWQRMQGYVPAEGEKLVNDALKKIGREQRLRVMRIKDWERVKLPNPRPNIHAFIDCALYKVQLK